MALIVLFTRQCQLADPPLRRQGLHGLPTLSQASMVRYWLRTRMTRGVPPRSNQLTRRGDDRRGGRSWSSGRSSPRDRGSSDRRHSAPRPVVRRHQPSALPALPRTPFCASASAPYGQSGRRPARCCSGWSRSTSRPINSLVRAVRSATKGRSGLCSPRAEAHRPWDPLRAGGTSPREEPKLEILLDGGREDAGAARGGVAAASRRGPVSSPSWSRSSSKRQSLLLGGQPDVFPAPASPIRSEPGVVVADTPVVPRNWVAEGHTPKRVVVRVLLANVHAGAMRAISAAPIPGSGGCPRGLVRLRRGQCRPPSSGAGSGVPGSPCRWI